MSALAEALASGGRYIKWDELGMGATVTGTITHMEMRQARKYGSTDLDFWDDGKAKMQAVITFSTLLRDPRDPDDDGVRSLSVNLWSGQKKALVAACKAAGVVEPTPGQPFTATWAGGAGGAGDPRQFRYTLGAAPSGVAEALRDTTAPVPPPAATGAPAAAQEPPTAPVAARPAATTGANAAETARELLAAGMTHAEVAAATGLSPTTVAALAGLPF